MTTKAIPILTAYCAKQQHEVAVHLEWDVPTHDGTTPIRPASIQKYRIQTGRATKFGAFGTLVRTDFTEPSVRRHEASLPSGQYAFKVHVLITV